MRVLRFSRLLALLPMTMLLAACATTPREPIATVDPLDLERFMGDWYVIASIPTFLEEGAHNAVESYELLPDGRVATTFRFRKGSFDGPLKVYNPIGFVSAENNAVWGMQFVWPVKADYRVTYLDGDYRVTVIGREKRDYLWVMARDPVIAEEEYARVLAHVAAQGYDVSQLRPVPQRWPELAGPGPADSGAKRPPS